jgi:hypothetical protein
LADIERSSGEIAMKTLSLLVFVLTLFAQATFAQNRLFSDIESCCMPPDNS